MVLLMKMVLVVTWNRTQKSIGSSNKPYFLEIANY